MTISNDEIKIVYPNLRYYALKLTLGNIDEAEDLLQDTLLRILEKKEQIFLNGEKSFLKWGASIMHNMYIDKCRFDKIRGRKVYIEDLNNFNPYYNQDEISRVVAVHTKIVEIKNKIRKCSQIKRDLPMFLMRNIGLSYKEIADHLKIPLGTLKSRLYDLNKCVKTTF